MMLKLTSLEKYLDSLIQPAVPGVVLALSHNQEQFTAAKGNLHNESQFFIASATKLYVTALIMQLIDAGKITLSSKIIDLLPPETTDRLHVFKGIDYTHQITVEHLLSHTSGLPDYFQAVDRSGKSLMNHILTVADQDWNFKKVISDSKELGAVFPPSSGKALYSDTNYQILGYIVESLTGLRLGTAIAKNICQPLQMTKTYLYEDVNDSTPVSLSYKKRPLKIPKAMVSFGPDGGIVSTAPDGIKFLKGFFEARLFDPKHLPYLTSTWRNIFFPLKYGVGISLFRLPWFFSPFKKVPDLIGHSGLSGAFLFYCPSKDIYLAGTVNQIDKPQTSFKVMIKSIMSLSEVLQKKDKKKPLT